MREMKDSGIEWIGVIPKHWEMIKMKYLFKIIGSGGTPKTSDREYYDGEHNWLQTGDLNDGEVISTSKTITQKAVDECSTLVKYKKGSLVIALYGATIGKLGILDIDTYTNQACCVMQEPIKTNMKFVYYWLLCNRENIINMSLGGGQPNISQGMINSLKISVPKPLSEQQQIAIYLDKKCAEIDDVIKGKEDENKALEEYRKSVIYEAVTKGLNPDAEMKDSGIEWIGDIPKDWEIWKLKHVTQDRNDKYSGENFSYIAMENIESCTCRLLETQSEYDLTSAIVAQKDDVIFGKLRPYLAKVYRITLPSLVNSEFVVLNPIKILSTYLKYYLINPSFINYINSSTYGTKMPRASVEFILDSPIPVCNIKEQQQIAEYLDKKCEEIDTLIKANIDLIDNLKQYKKSIIFEAVTGKTEIA